MTEMLNKKLGTVQLDVLKKFGERIGKLGATFAFYDLDGELVLEHGSGTYESDWQFLAGYAKQVPADDCEQLYRYDEENGVISAKLRAAGELVGVGLIDLSQPGVFGGDKIDEGLGRCYEEMLSMLAENFDSVGKAEAQTEMVSSELAQTYEELVLLYKMSTNMKVTHSDCNYLQMACDCLTDLVSVEGIAILLEKKVDGVNELVLTAGSGLIGIDPQMAHVIYSRLNEELKLGREVMLDSDVDSEFKYDWPDRIKSIIAVPLYSGDKNTGMMVATNRLGKSDFDSIDMKLFNSVANECAVFIENERLFKDLKELFIGALKALTNSIDAKDQYTRGHSERVALISRWIADKASEKFSLGEECVHKTYLAGLLHDVGKIGIGESVLCKQGPLNPSERKQIEAHPAIGAGILSNIKQMDDIISGVLCHHERIDGKGYPNGICGDEIDLLGKIVMLADSFDAMTSRRSYREAMSIEEALGEIERGLGTQFDKELGMVFLDSDVYRLWDIMQTGKMDEWSEDSFSEYSTVAVGTLIR